MASHSDEGTTNCQQETTKLDIKALEDLPHVVLEESNPADNNRSSRRKRIATSSLNARTIRWICIGLHISILALHIALIAVWSRHVEHRVVVPLTESESASTVVVVVSQIFITLFTVSLVLTTQQLALRGTLLRRQTLTASHDETTAWTGLGSALVTLWRQTYLAASVLGTLSIALYLAGIAVLHVSTPSLFALQPFNNTDNGVISTTVGMPSFFLNESADPSGSQAPFTKMWTDTNALLPYLQRVNPKNTIGVSNATLYDVPDDNSGVNNITVGATALNVTCGMISNATAVNTNSSDPTSTWTIVASYDGYNFSFPAALTVPYVIRQKSYLVVSEPSTQILARNVFFYSSANLTDSKGNLGSVVELQPPMVNQINDTTSRTLYSLQLLGCTLSLVEQQAIVDAQRKSLVAASPSATKTASEWTNWHPELQSSSNHWAWIQDPSVDAWGDLFFYMPEGTVDASGTCTGPDDCDKLTLSEEYIMQRLGLYPEDTNSVFNIGTTTLHDFENTLATMSASLYWAAANIESDQFAPPGFNNSLGGHAELLRGEARISTTEARLNLNITPLAVGLGTSAVLLALAVLLVRAPDGYDAAINTVGVLQLLWLVNGRPSLREQVSQVDEPTIDNLRAAGMFEVRVASEMKGDDGSYKLVRLESSDDRARYGL